MQSKHATIQPHSIQISTNIRLVRLWARLRYELLYISWAAMEMLLIVPIALSLMPWISWSQTAVSFSVLAAILLPFYLARLMNWFSLAMRIQQRAMFILAFMLILWSIRTLNYEMESLFDFRWIAQFFQNLAIAGNNLWQRDVGLFTLIGLAWWRGIVLVTREVDIVRFGERFRRGGLFIAPLAVLLAYFQLDYSIMPFILLFFLLGVTAVALTRAEQAEQHQHSIIATISPKWLSTIIGTGLLTTFTAAAVSTFVASSPGQINHFLTPVWQALRFFGASIGLMIIYLISPLLTVFNALLNGILDLLKWLGARLFVPVDQPPQDDAPVEGVREQLQKYLLDNEPLSSEWIINWKIVLLILLIIAVLIAVYALGRYYDRNKVATANGRFTQILDSFIGQISGGKFSLPKRRKEKAFDWETAVSIQRIYEQMAQTAKKLGFPRAEMQTPYEYLPTLHQLWPQHTADTQRITHAYIRARYGELPDTIEAFQRIKQAWKQIEKTAKEQIKQEKKGTN